MIARTALVALALAACSGGASGDLGPDAGAYGTADAPASDAAPEPDFASLPWTTIGTGVAFKDSENPRGDNVFVGYAGYGVTDAEAQTWVTALYEADLKQRGVRYVYAVRGPDDVEYTNKEIQNTHLIAHMLPQVSTTTGFIAIAGHSSGGWVACELLQQLYDQGLDPAGKTTGKAVYYDLDGVESCLDTTIVHHLRAVYFVSAHTNAGSGGYSLNAPYMMMGAMMFGAKFLLYDATSSGCEPSADLCLHVTLVDTKPHDPTTGTPSDYGGVTSATVNRWYLEQTATDL